MNDRSDLHRSLSAWLAAQAPNREPDGLLERVTAELDATRRLPGWVVPERWLPMQTTARFGTAARTVIILALLTLLLASLAAIGVGSQPGPVPAPPFGLARNGLIAFDAGGDIWVADPDGSDPRLFVSGPGLDIDPTFSPDGTKLAFWSLEAPEDSLITIDDTPDVTTVSRLLGSGRASLLVSDVDDRSAAEPRVIVEDLRLDSLGMPPSWSPASDALAYGHVEEANKVIDIVDLASGKPRRVTSGDSPSWSPDGVRLAYRSATFPNGVMVVGVDGSGTHQVTTVPGSGYAFAGPQWSPDGQTIAFYAGSDGDHDIWAVSADGSNEEPVSGDVADEYWPAWSPDGTRLAFLESGDHVVVADQADRWAATQLESDRLGVTYPLTWSPDGTRLIGFPLARPLRPPSP